MCTKFIKFSVLPILQKAWHCYFSKTHEIHFQNALECFPEDKWCKHWPRNTCLHGFWEKIWGVSRWSQNVWQKARKPTHIFQSQTFSHEYYELSLTLRVLSTSPQGNRFTKSMPVRGVPVGGSKMDASIIRYSTFRGLFYTQRTHTQRKRAKTWITQWASWY